MESNDRETISRVLEAALASLKSEPSGNAASSRSTAVTSINLPSTGVQVSGAPVVILIHPHSTESASIPTTPAAQAMASNSCGCHHAESPLHPAIERFPLSEPDSRDSSKMCFIEPDRVCVGSGACEALGY